MSASSLRAVDGVVYIYHNCDCAFADPAAAIRGDLVSPD